MATQLNTTNHSALNTAMSDLFKSGACCGVNMTIYTDSVAATIATDANGNIEKRKINQIINTASYVDPKTNQTVKANIKILFSDGTTITSFDDSDNYFYKIEGEAFTTRTF